MLHSLHHSLDVNFFPEISESKLQTRGPFTSKYFKLYLLKIGLMWQHNHSMINEIKTLTLVQHYYITNRLFSVFTIAQVKSFMTKYNPKSHVAVCCVSFYSALIWKKICPTRSFIALTFLRSWLFCDMSLRLRTSNAFLWLGS